MTNTSDAVVDGWSVSWEHTDGSAVTNSWSTSLAGNNPYTASSMSWNAAILPGATVVFGMQVTKGSDAAEIPTLTGELCN